MRVADSYFALIPRPMPSLQQFQRCKIVSHRGEHNNSTVKENTLAAFDAALAGGVWGIECDIRWTADLHPVVSHDEDCRRIFNKNIRIADVTLEALRTAVPELPTLEEIVQRYGKKMHLMLEIKEEVYPQADRQSQHLKRALAVIQPVEDYHFLALDLALFARVDFSPKESFLPVAELNHKEFSAKALAAGYAGLSGHYLLLGDAIATAHSNAEQKMGTGFIASRYALYRELNRDVEWIFSNNAVRIKAVRDAAIRKLHRPNSNK